jgi:hypothetical protein
MKIVSWNLKNIGQNKLNNQFNAGYLAYGLGNNVLDFMMGLVMGSDRWNAVAGLSTTPADVFTVIELKTGGQRKGFGVTGTCLPTLNAIVNAMNLSALTRYGNNNTYSYTYVVPPVLANTNGPLVTGYHETVGFIYNTVSLTYRTADTLVNDTTGNYILPRTPYGCQFEFVATPGTFMQLIGIHAPPPKGSQATRLRPPIDYCRYLPTSSDGVNNYANMANTMFMGDFNCNPGSSYVSAKRDIHGNNFIIRPFPQLYANGYDSLIPNGTLSSVKTRVAAGAVPPYPQTAYLSDAYDNIILNGPAAALGGGSNELVVNMIGESRNMNAVGTPNLLNTNLRALVNAFNTVSDHLPVVIEW